MNLRLVTLVVAGYVLACLIGSNKAISGEPQTGGKLILSAPLTHSDWVLKDNVPGLDDGLSPLRGQDGIEVPKTTHDPGLYLFVDDHWVADQQGLTRIHNRAQPLEEPIIWPDDPKTETDCAWGNVIREPDGRFRMWYVTMTMGHNGAGPHEIARASGPG